ncbi:PhzF family phenazine biosynthesis protein [Cellulomonas carbonis]|uniref:Phenazine biosynthesis protein PhzF n=1 Tax=Cellulomonas carbonis T26 TaxID=947969 RepID=A0A0A0BT72_9CELL|nr:PhzF family phenazine biosynthesis isomerase [Cellulomonas carbonis]KGM10882.1 phenazine biosynthesis protein PhzF [Cellulomonas carbonis T26]GGC00371.1 oxidoreductase [Cellulomonas carbonis]
MSTDVLRLAAFPDGSAPGGGNPAGVVLDATGLDDAERQRVAAEVGYSETAFLERIGPARYRVRYFTPTTEVAFCGHATVAAGVALAERGHGPDLLLETLAGEVPVTTAPAGPDDPGPTATLTSVPTRTRPAEPAQVAATLAAIGWSAADLDPRFPPHVAFAGNDHLVLAAATRERLARLDQDEAALAAVMRAGGWTTVHLVHARDATTFDARDPAPAAGISEDPATGSAAAAFGGYLRDLGLVPAPSRVVVLQGHDMGAPSRLVVDVLADDRRVRVTGSAVPIG